MATIDNSNTPDESQPIENVEQITKFQEDRAEVTTTYPALISSAHNISKIMENRKHNIIDVLSRPHQIANFQINSTNNTPLPFSFTQGEYQLGIVSGLLDSWEFPKTLYTSNIVSKLSNFLYLKANIEITVRVNANPFQQGKLWLTFSPYSSVSKIGKQRQLLNEHRRAVSNFPGVEIDIGAGNEGTIVIPYCSPLKAYPLVSTFDGDMGFARLYILNQLADGTDDPRCNVTVYARFTEVKVEIPTVSTPSLLMTEKNKVEFYRSLLEVMDINPDEFFDFLPKQSKLLYSSLASSFEEIPRAQGGETGEIAATSKGIVTNIANSVSNAASSLSEVPVIGEFAKTVSWVSKFVSHVTSYLGWSKPTSIENTNGYYNYPSKNYTHFEGVDNSVILSAIPDNHLECTNKLFVSEADEMSFNYILSRPTLETTFNWTTSDEESKVLAKLPCEFQHHFEDVLLDAAISGKADFSGVQRYVLNSFALWSGNIRMKISIVKTGFHAGRLQFIWTPFTDITPSTDLRGDCYSEVIDLRQTNEVTMTLNFTSPTNYCSTDTEIYTGSAIPSGPPTGFGTVHVVVINPLITNENCSDTCPINVWYSFEPGVELACPTNRRFVPFSMESVASESTDVGIAQGGVVNDTSNEFSNMDSDYQPLVKINGENSMSDSLQCIGERMDNLRMLTRRFTLNTFINSSSVNYLSKVRYGFKKAYQEGTTAQIDSVRAIVDNVEYFSWIYRFVRGSERFKFLKYGNISTTEASNQGAYVSGPKSKWSDYSTSSAPSLNEDFRTGFINQNGVLTSNTNPTTVFRPSVLASTASTILSTAFNNVLEIVIPSYSNVNKQVIGGTFTAEEKTSYPFLTWFSNHNRTNNYQTAILRAMGDDASFGWLIGPPVTLDLSSFEPLSESEDFDFSLADSVQLMNNDYYLIRAPRQFFPDNNDILAPVAATSEYSGTNGVMDFISTTVFETSGDDRIKIFVKEIKLPTGTFNPTTTLSNIQALGIVPFILQDNNQLFSFPVTGTVTANSGSTDFPSAEFPYSQTSSQADEANKIPNGNYLCKSLETTTIVTPYDGSNGFTTAEDIGITVVGDIINVFYRELGNPTGTIDYEAFKDNLSTLSFIGCTGTLI